MVRREMAQQRERVDPRADPVVRFGVLEIVDDELHLAPLGGWVLESGSRAVSRGDRNRVRCSR